MVLASSSSSSSGGIRVVDYLGGDNETDYEFGFGLFNFGPRGSAPGSYNHHRIMQVMPNGSILVPDMNNNRVCIVGSASVIPSTYNVTSLT